MITSKYFREAEFQRLTPACSLQDMKQETMDMLDKARAAAGVPFVLTCAYRSVAWDKSKGRDGKSAHTTGHALDIAATTSGQRLAIVRGLLAAGCRRIGIGKNFIHADNDPGKPQDVMFHYYG